MSSQFGDQYLCMTFAQLTYRESLRDIETCLRTMKSKLYHMGFRSGAARNTLANANSVRDWRIYGDFAQILIRKAKALYSGEDFGIELDNAVYALDSTVIDLCLALFPWARFHKTKAAVKLHTLLDLRGNIPTTVIITPGNIHDVTILDELCLESSAIYIMDRGYLDFGRLYTIHKTPAFFVTRAKKNTKFRKMFSRPTKKSGEIMADQIGMLTGYYPRKHYPEKLRRIVYIDRTINKRLVFLTNNMNLSAKVIANLYKSRWQVELFFKWIKQHLKIKAFYGTSENAVKTQIWIAISVYVLIAIIKKQLNLKLSLYSILQVLSVALFEKTPILTALTSADYLGNRDLNYEQMPLLKETLGH
ncbi:IS4 family transposase [Candidatus Gottesmanbacteria bacterium]|nr:IS4 family transposase [Candidatus Gottesmanbacteria bacterium]